MRNEPINFSSRSSLTRISVSGHGDYYVVRNGNDAPVRVWVRGEALQCDCGRPRCAHIASLEMCGFVEAPFEERRAA